MDIFVYLVSWIAVIALGVAVVAAPARRHRRRRKAHYESHPDPLFGPVDE